MQNGGAIDLDELGRAFVRVAEVLLFGVLPIVLSALVLAWTFGSTSFLSDFHGDLYSAGREILRGADPYRVAFLAREAAIARAGGHPSTVFAVPVYPAPALLAATPLALLPYRVAGLVFTGLGIVSLAAGLRLLGVRDWRCLGCALLSWPVLHTVRLGQVNGFLVLGAGIAWHERERVLRPVLAVAGLIVAKVFLWPLVLFGVLRGRWRRLTLSLGAAAVVLLGAWALLGFAGLASYPRMLGDLSAVEGTAGISLQSVAAALGLPPVAGEAAGIGLSAGLVGVAWLALRMAGERVEESERSAFGLLVLAGLAASSLVWPHYLTLLFVPIALLSPSLGPLWLVPLLCWVAPVELTHGHLLNILPYLACETIVTVALCRRAFAASSAFLQDLRPLEAKGPPEAAGRLARALISNSFRSQNPAGNQLRGYGPPTKLG